MRRPFERGAQHSALILERLFLAPCPGIFKPSGTPSHLRISTIRLVPQNGITMIVVATPKKHRSN
jgi:hypothetical protein